MENRKKLLWLTRTALFIALLVVAQYLTAGTHQLVTGSVVNLILIASALLVGPLSGMTVAIISPFLAKLIGIGPLWSFVPVIALGNLVIVAVFALLLGKNTGKVGLKQIALWVVTIGAGAFAKFLVIYVGINKIIVPIIADTLKAPQIQKFSVMFAWPQLFTALIGGGLAMAIIQPLKIALKGKK